ncbi:hypothetical protein TD95_002291 [Thielaviopsis punctulata]|uniref:Endo-beta-1,6-galactanase-like domain-containing protein n=1 Tax=Thielaviopsis punctulata TaxID=72032 RepID=A0A0F4ZA09_9PEZI|nr:hypothetical protein TD95_002291 [Thielaviopsis punctulata]
MSMRILSAVLAAGIPLVAADTNLKVDTSLTYGTWEGWGTSLAWWAATFGDRDDLADIFFTTKNTTFNGQTLPGLGLTIARYNAGACSYNEVDGARINLTSHMNPTRAMDGFWIDPSSNDITSNSFNWTTDANQRAMLTKAIDRGVTHAELFSNSPMWWMLENHNPAGGNTGGNNLANSNFDKHADYLAAIAEKAAKDWNVTFASIEPFNEPVADWWKGPTGTQEGCHFDATSQPGVLSALSEKMKARSISSKTIISASDENEYDQAVSTWNTIGPSAQALVGRINVHGYQYQNGDRAGVYELAIAGKKALWDSEYGDSDATGTSLVSNLILDFRWLHPTGWVYWQVLDSGGWGMIDADNNAKTINSPTTKYFAMAQFSRHIRPGMVIVSMGENTDNAVAAYDVANKKLVIVAVNWGDNQNFFFDLSNFAGYPASGSVVPTWVTDLSNDGNKYVMKTNNMMDGSKFSATLTKNSVQTFEISDVTIS